MNQSQLDIPTHGFGMANNAGHVYRHEPPGSSAIDHHHHSDVSQDAWLKDLEEKLAIEYKIKDGAENLIEMFDTNMLKMKDKDHLRRKAELELDAASSKIQLLQSQLDQSGTRSAAHREMDEIPLIRKSYSATNSNLVSHSPDETDRQRTAASGSPTWSLGDLLQSIDTAKQPEVLVDRANDLVDLLQKNPLLKYNLALSQVGDKIRVLLLHQNSEVVASGYRIARTAITGLESLRNIRDLFVDYLIARSLCKDSKSQIERTQALRLVRAFLDVPDGVEEIALGVVRAIVAVAEQSDDKLRTAALETLTEIFVFSPRKVACSGGTKVLLQTIVDGPYELSAPISMAFAYCLEFPGNRNLFRNGRDLEFLVSPFTEVQIKTVASSERLRNCARVIAALLRTWSGIFAFSVDNFHALRALFSCLNVGVSQLRDILLDMVLMLLCIKPVAWSSSFLAGRRLTTLGRVPLENIVNLSSKPGSSRSQAAVNRRYNDSLNSLLLRILAKCGLIEGLTIVLERETDDGVLRKATLLVGEILQMAGKLSLYDDVLDMATLPSLFALAMERHGGKVPGRLISAASSAVIQIEKVSRTLNRSILAEASLPTTQPWPKPKMGQQIDDATFKQLVAETRVPYSKKYLKWRWDILADLLQGPLLNPRKLEEAIKIPKFMKRLIRFYRPFKYRFSCIKRTKPSQKYVDVGCMLITTLLNTQEGVRYLTEQKLLPQIAECLAQLDSASNITSAKPLFSRSQLENTLSFGYFQLLGTLSSDPRGIAMMERWRMFNMMYHLTSISSREDLTFGLISALDYTHVGHARIIMSKTLTTGDRYVRSFATNHLRKLVNSPAATQKWAVNLLSTQLYDPDIEVCKLAVQVLEAFCDNPQNLEHLVSLKPSLDHLGDIGTALFLRFLSTSKGFQYLEELDYVNREMDNWLHGQNDIYVVQMEEYLESTLSLFGPSSDSIEATPFSPPPRHFFGELTYTYEGSRLLQSCGYFDQFVSYISEHKHECEDGEIILKLKGCLWAVGNICSNSRGVPFLEDCDVVQDIVEIFNTSERFSARGTAYFVLGLISTTQEGAEILDEFSWPSVRDAVGQPRGLCFPMDFSSSFNLTSESGLSQVDLLPRSSSALMSRRNTISSDSRSILGDEADYSDRDSQGNPMGVSVRRKIMSALTDLSNQILANEASKQLVKLETKYGSKFSSYSLFVEAMHLLESYHYKLPVRRFIFELFDMSGLLERVAKKQREQRRSRHLSDASGKIKLVPDLTKEEQPPTDQSI